MDTFLLDRILHTFLAEDLEHGDITTEAIFAPEDRARACCIARHPMTVVGMATVATRVFSCSTRASAARTRSPTVPGWTPAPNCSP